ncbi:MAG: hypothetical protein Q8T09_01065 [Candidatus Melainabacteria bacterium]|nr:hypothetical protein [Candidatus Melainabacteria bacterium]
MTNMKIVEQSINGKTYLCQVTPHERNLIAAGQSVNITPNRRVQKRLGIPRSVQLSAAGLAWQPVIF